MQAGSLEEVKKAPDMFDRIFRQFNIDLALAESYGAVHFNNRSAAPFTKLSQGLPGLKPLLAEQVHESVCAHDDYLYAWQSYARILQECTPKLEILLGNGDFLIFDNRRLLHGRTEYTLDEGTTRWLQGCYLDGDEVYSRVCAAHLNDGDMNGS